ncbi:MAG: putative deacylase [halophilic archaeon J07HX5]|nr:MAG: putative deacylase [halophilic archaeon J07HX5]
MIDETRIRCGRRHRLHNRCLSLQRHRLWTRLDQKGPEGQLARAAPDEGIPTVDPELGGSVGLDEASVQTGLDGVFNVLRHYEFLSGRTRTETQTRATGFEQYGSPAGGLIDFQVSLGERVERGRTLFEVTDVFGESKGTVTADSDGIFWRTRRRPQVASGEYVCSVGTNIDSF